MLVLFFLIIKYHDIVMYSVGVSIGNYFLYFSRGFNCGVLTVVVNIF